MHNPSKQSINVVAVGVNELGEREILGFDIGMSESGPFWTEFLRRLVDRGLHGLKLVISDAHQGLKEAISGVLGECAWQRCRVHFMRNILCQVPRKQQGMVSAIIFVLIWYSQHWKRVPILKSGTPCTQLLNFQKAQKTLRIV